MKEKINVSDLSGPKLDYYTAKAMGLDAELSINSLVCMLVSSNPVLDGAPFMPSTLWSHGSMLVDAHKVSPMYVSKGLWQAGTVSQWDNNEFECGATALEACCRAFVASVYGQQVVVSEQKSTLDTGSDPDLNWQCQFGDPTL